MEYLIDLVYSFESLRAPVGYIDRYIVLLVFGMYLIDNRLF
jgi:hypothetical protein